MALKNDSEKEKISPLKKRILNIREQKYRQRQISLLIKKMFVLIIIIVFVLSIFGVYILIRNTKLNRIEYTGLNRLNALDIEYAANLVKYNNKSIFTISFSDVKKDVEKHNLVRVKNIKRSLPDMIIIEIEEKPIVVLLEYKGLIYEVSDDLHLIRNSRIFNYNVPYLTGFEIDTNKAVVEDEYTKYIINTLVTLQTNDLNIYNMISEINASNKDLVLYPRLYKTKVILEKNIKIEKLNALSGILKTLQDTGKKISIVDFRFKDAILK